MSASCWTRALKPSRHYVFTPRIGLVRNIPECLPSLTHQPTGGREPIPQDFDLSKNRSLRSLEIAMKDISQCPDLTLRFFRDILSTITSSVFSDLVIVLEERTTRYADFFQHALFTLVRRVYEARPFRLVFSLETRHDDREHTVGMLKKYIDAEAAAGGLNFLPCPPVILSSTRVRYRLWDGFTTHASHVL